MSFDVMGLIGAAGNFLGNIGNNIFQGLNYKHQKEAYEWQKEQYGIMQQREDTAVQRRVADLKAAGLSPTLAAGSAAQAHQPIQAHAPQMGQLNKIGLAEAYLSLVTQKANIARTNAETDRIKVLTQRDEQGIDLDKQEIQIRLDQLGLDRQRVEHDAQRIGISFQQLANDAIRISHDAKRIDHDAQRLLNEQERITIEQNHYDLARLMNSAQRGLIEQQTFSEELRQYGISQDSSRKFWENVELIYNLSIMSSLNMPTHGTLPREAFIASNLANKGAVFQNQAQSLAGRNTRYTDYVDRNESTRRVK